MWISSVVLIVINSLRFQPFPESDSMVLVDTKERSSTKSKYFYLFSKNGPKGLIKCKQERKSFFQAVIVIFLCSNY